MGIYIPNVDYYDLYNWLWDIGKEHILDNCTIIKTPHGELKDFDKVTSYKICGVIDCENRKTFNVTGRVILDKDWQNAPTVIEAEE